MNGLEAFIIGHYFNHLSREESDGRKVLAM
jgi:hypothetical protein